MKYIVAIFCTAFTVTAQAKVVDLLEDYSVSKAPQEIIDITERAANKVGFTQNYEVAIPTKAGIQLNPLNNFITYTINPASKNPVLLINSTWFSQIPADQQDFLLGRYFVTFQQGLVPWSVTIVSGIFIIISLLLMISFVFLLGRTQLATKPMWIRIIIAIALMISAEKLVLDTIEQKIKTDLMFKHAYAINELTVQKLGDRDVAIKAFEHFDASMKAELKNGALALAPFEKAFEKYIQALKK